MRIGLAVIVASLLAPAAARADLTVIFASPSRPAPLVAVRVSPGPSPVTEPVRASVSEPDPAPVGAPPAPLASPSAPVLRSAPEPVPPTVAAPAAAVEPVAVLEPEPVPVRERGRSEARCVQPAPVRFIRTTDGSREARLLALTDCHGVPDPESLLELSILARPRTADRPDARDLAAHVDDPELFASEVRRLDPGLLTRLRAIGDRFPGHDIEITSGYRPDARESSRHRTGHALDLRVLGVPLEEVHAFALGFDESGIGLYPTSEFLHVDVRPRVTRWVDLAGPGEPTQLVEVVNGRDGHASSAPPLQWPTSGRATATGRTVVRVEPARSPVTPARAPSEPRARRARRASSEDDHRAALREALDALDALEGLDLGVPRS
jgi:hypothetical protein